MYRSLLIWRCVGVEGEKRGEAPGEMYRPQMHEGERGGQTGQTTGSTQVVWSMPRAWLLLAHMRARQVCQQRPCVPTMTTTNDPFSLIPQITHEEARVDAPAWP